MGLCNLQCACEIVQISFCRFLFVYCFFQIVIRDCFVKCVLWFVYFILCKLFCEKGSMLIVKTPTTTSIQLNTTTIDVGFDTIMTVHHPHHPARNSTSATYSRQGIVNYYNLRQSSQTILESYPRLSQTILDYLHLSSTIFDYLRLSLTILYYLR